MICQTSPQFLFFTFYLLEGLPECLFRVNWFGKEQPTYWRGGFHAYPEIPRGCEAKACEGKNVREQGYGAARMQEFHQVKRLTQEVNGTLIHRGHRKKNMIQFNTTIQNSCFVMKGINCVFRYSYLVRLPFLNAIIENSLLCGHVSRNVILTSF